MDHITRLVDGIYVGASDPAVYAPGSPQAALQDEALARHRAKWAGLIDDLLAFNPTRSSSVLLPRPGVEWTPPENGQEFAARLAKAISLSYETPLGLQVTDCLMLATEYPHERAFTLLKDLEIGLEHAVAACVRIPVPSAPPLIARARLLNRVLNLQADKAVGDPNRILYLLAMAGLVIAGQDKAQMTGLRRFLTHTVLEWQPLRRHPLAQALLDDFLDLQWPADPARALKQAVYDLLGRGRDGESTPTTPREPAPKTTEAETLERLRRAQGAFVATLQREAVGRLRRRGWRIESVREARKAGKPVPPDAKGHRLLEH